MLPWPRVARRLILRVRHRACRRASSKPSVIAHAAQRMCPHTYARILLAYTFTLQAAEAKAAVAKAMDADGFTIVRHSSSAAGGAGAGPGDSGGAGSGGLIESDNVKRKKKRGSIVVTNFYRFQRQDAKMDRESTSAAAAVFVGHHVCRSARSAAALLVHARQLLPRSLPHNRVFVASSLRCFASFATRVAAGLAELRAKFEEDKARVAKLKTTHAFKPY